MATQLEFLNNALLAIGERDYMTATLVSSNHKRAYQCFYEAVQTFTHDFRWSFLYKTKTPTSFVLSVVTLPEFQEIRNVSYVKRELVGVREIELRQQEAQVGEPHFYSILNNTEILVYPTPVNWAVLKFYLIEEFVLTPFNGQLTIPTKYLSCLRELLCAKLSLQILDDIESYKTFMQAYMANARKLNAADKRVDYSFPNMYRCK